MILVSMTRMANFTHSIEHSDASAIVLFIQGNGCPIVRNAVHDLNAIREEYAPKGVQFLMLNANLQDDRESVREEAEAFSIGYPILIDEAQLVARNRSTCTARLKHLSSIPNVAHPLSGSHR